MSSRADEYACAKAAGVPPAFAIALEALESIDRERPDAVVLDLIMPRLDGFAVLERLQLRRKQLPDAGADLVQAEILL